MIAAAALGAKALSLGSKLPWKWIGLALVVLAVLGGVHLNGRAGGRAAERAVWAPKLEASKRDFDTCKANTITLDEARARQNAAVAKAKAEGDRRAAAGEKAAREARGAAQAASERAARIMAAKPGADSCRSAFELVRESIR